ncbi:WD40/YVTN/BNR-like repeat-containing protein [Streptomyces sp. NPDC015346]|uniref:WD40/YVTN/BNR-like repeat-containing protein n=1 Tax=Streptomyces sp. NPDC015346 TaxID=3364954 RepID=UPI0036FA8A7F
MRRLMGAAGAVVALVLTACTGTGAGSGAGAGTASGSERGATGSTAPGPAGGPATAPPPRIPSAAQLPGWSHSLGFASDGSGFTLLASCVEDETAPAHGFCRQHVAVLDRGAKEWALRRSPLPETRGGIGVSSSLVVLGPGRALVEEGGDRPETSRTWFTRDGGRSWKEGSRRTVGRAPVIPAGAVLTTECAQPAGSYAEDCPRERLVVISPHDGRRRTLARQPLLGAHPRPAEAAEPDGSWWASGTDPLSGRAAVAVSRDAGRSWSVSRLPSPTTEPGWYTTVVVGPDAVYAAEMGELKGGEPVKNPMRALHRSVDGGRTWERMWTTGPMIEPRTLVGLPVPGQGGRVLIGAEDREYVSVDGGRSFRPSGEAARYVRRTPLGLLRHAAGCSYGISADGVRWAEFRLACEDDS